MREILLIEDSDDDAAQVRRALDLLCVTNPVRRFVNGEDARVHLNSVAQMAAIGPPPATILFIDVVLPQLSGLQILESISTQPIFQKTLRIVLTNLSDTNTIKQAYSLGAHSFLIKPVQPDDLKELIEAFPGHWSFKVERPNPFLKAGRGSRVPTK